MHEPEFNVKSEMEIARWRVAEKVACIDPRYIHGIVCKQKQNSFSRLITGVNAETGTGSNVRCVKNNPSNGDIFLATFIHAFGD